MNASRPGMVEPQILPKDRLPELIRILQEQGYQVVAPVEEGSVLAMRPVSDAGEIACGIEDTQAPGHYRILDGPAPTYFDNVVGPDGPKRYFFPPHLPLFSFSVDDDGFVLEQVAPEPPRLAFLGVRPCDLSAIRVQDRVFGHEDNGQVFRCESETYYMRAREAALIIVVNCTRPGGSCFCGSWGTGPEATEGFDLSLTELRGSFLVRAGSSSGVSVLDALSTEPATEAERELAYLKVLRAREHMGRVLKTDGLGELLRNNPEHQIWQEIGDRCLGCGNCTMVCPTCFCSTVTDSNDLVTGNVTRTREWESCFTHQFSYVTSGPVRASISSRYRHWLRHKLSGWWEQFDMSGCVGCGRCLTWCPVAIDWTQDIAQLQREVESREAQRVSSTLEATS